MQASSTSSSIQDLSEHAVLPAVEPVPLRQTEIDVDEPTVLEVLTDYSEVTFERGDLPDVSELSFGCAVEPHEPPRVEVVQDVAAPVQESPRESLTGLRPAPEWCVDQDGSILAMTSFELWMALAQGEVDSKTRVWGLGMDNWERVADVPELAHALKDSLSLADPPVLPQRPEVHFGRGHDRTPLGFGTTDAANDDFPAHSGPISLRRKGISLGRIAVAAGALAAAAAVGLTVVPRASDVTAQAAANQAVAVARLQSAMERANRQVEEATHRRLEADAARAVAPVAPSAKHHRDAGQRRVRRGHH